MVARWQARVSRRLRRTVARLVGPLIFHEGVDANGRVVGTRPLVGRANQWLMESGRVPPWIMTKGECLEFWRTRSNDSAPGNRPVDYLRKPVAIAEYLHDFWQPWVQSDSGILEVGCNAGTNLEVLRRLGYHRLAGIEVNEAALRELRKVYPDLWHGASFYLASAEKGLRSMSTASFDVVFTIAVAMHIHPSDNYVFAEMVRVAR